MLLTELGRVLYLLGLRLGRPAMLPHRCGVTRTKSGALAEPVEARIIAVGKQDRILVLRCFEWNWKSGKESLPATR
jgi:hypothetical protein